MKLQILNISKEEIGKQELPAQFNEDVRPDLIKRAVISIQSNARQAYGADPMAGKKSSAVSPSVNMCPNSFSIIFFIISFVSMIIIARGRIPTLPCCV